MSRSLGRRQWICLYLFYGVTRDFPKDELFGLTSQLRRCSVSVASNAAEGQGRATVGELIHFLGMARGSALEVETQLELATRLEIGDPGKILAAQKLANEVSRILSGAMSGLRSTQAARKLATSTQ